MGARIPSRIESPEAVDGLTGAGVRVRRMTADDVPGVIEIEERSFTMPWNVSMFHRLMARGDAELWVAEDRGGRLQGYAVLWCILDQAELANLAVLPETRGRGIGARLLEHVLEVARSRGVKEVFLEVRASNEVAANLYLERGFQEVGWRRNYYDKPREDARVLRRRVEP